MFAGRARTMATPSSEPWLTVTTSVAPHRSLDNEQPARGSHHGQYRQGPADKMDVKQGPNPDADKLDGKNDKLDGTGQRRCRTKKPTLRHHVIMSLIGQVDRTSQVASVASRGFGTARPRGHQCPRSCGGCRCWTGSVRAAKGPPTARPA